MELKKSENKNSPWKCCSSVINWTVFFSLFSRTWGIWSKNFNFWERGTLARRIRIKPQSSWSASRGRLQRWRKTWRTSSEGPKVCLLPSRGCFCSRGLTVCVCMTAADRAAGQDPTAAQEQRGERGRSVAAAEGGGFTSPAHRQKSWRIPQLHFVRAPCRHQPLTLRVILA